MTPRTATGRALYDQRGKVTSLLLLEDGDRYYRANHPERRAYNADWPAPTTPVPVPSCIA
jgi:hypothetical protein